MNKINLGCGWECRDGWLNVDNTQKPQKEKVLKGERQRVWTGNTRN